MKSLRSSPIFALGLVAWAWFICPPLLSGNDGIAGYLTPPRDGVTNASNAVDAKGKRHRGSDFTTSPPWLEDRVKAVSPHYPYEERLKHHQGRGMFQLTLDLKTGAVVGAKVLKSTGYKTLDEFALGGLCQWRWKPGKWRVIEIPVTFKLGDPSQTVPPGAIKLSPHP